MKERINPLGMVKVTCPNCGSSSLVNQQEHLTKVSKKQWDSGRGFLKALMLFGIIYGFFFALSFVLYMFNGKPSESGGKFGRIIESDKGILYSPLSVSIFIAGLLGGLLDGLHLSGMKTAFNTKTIGCRLEGSIR